MSLLPSSPKHDASLDLDKDLVHQIVLAKLQSSKTCDWYALSQKLNQDGKRGSGKKKEITGTELHDMDKRILPALKSGIILWNDGNNERRHVSASSSGSYVRPAEGTITLSSGEKGEHRVEAQENVCHKRKKQDG